MLLAPVLVGSQVEVAVLDGLPHDARGQQLWVEHGVEGDLLGEAEDGPGDAEDEVDGVGVFLLLDDLDQGESAVVDGRVFLVGLAHHLVKVVEQLCAITMDPILAYSFFGFW